MSELPEIIGRITSGPFIVDGDGRHIVVRNDILDQNDFPETFPQHLQITPSQLLIGEILRYDDEFRQSVARQIRHPECAAILQRNRLKHHPASRQQKSRLKPHRCSAAVVIIDDLPHVFRRNQNSDDPRPPGPHAPRNVIGPKSVFPGDPQYPILGVPAQIELFRLPVDDH